MWFAHVCVAIIFFSFLLHIYPPLLLKLMDTNNTSHLQQLSHSFFQNMVPVVEHGMRQPKTCQKCHDTNSASKKKKREAHKALKAASALTNDGLESVAKPQGVQPCRP